MTTLIGPIVTGTQVRAAVRSTVQSYMGPYLGDVAIKTGRDRDDLPNFRSYVSVWDRDRFVEDQLPSCMIISPGTGTLPEREGTTWSASWSVALGAMVAGQTADNTFELAELYTAALRALILQHKSLGGFARGIAWLGEQYDELPSDDRRTLALGSVQFRVEVEKVVDERWGLLTPEADPADEVGTVASTNVAVTRKPL